MATRAVASPRIVYTDHDMSERRQIRYVVARRIAAWIPDVNIGVSPPVTRTMARLAPSSPALCIIPGVEPAAPLAPPAAGPPHLVAVARLGPLKDHPTLLRALARIPQPLEVTMVGTGPRREELEALTGALDLRDRVRFTGFLHEPWSVAEGAWAAVLPTRTEGAGLALMEAMMRGLPVISMRVGGVAAVVDHGVTGLLAEPGDPGALADAITSLLDRPTRDRMGTAARAVAQRRFHVRRMVEEHLALYERLLAGRRIPGSGRE
jgi:glycosyltransferase involved in cell wall biosynthesis